MTPYNNINFFQDILQKYRFFFVTPYDNIFIHDTLRQPFFHDTLRQFFYDTLQQYQLFFHDTLRQYRFFFHDTLQKYQFFS